MSSKAKAPLTSTLFDDEAPTTQRMRLPDMTEDLDMDIDENDRSRPFLDDLIEDEDRATYPSIPPRSA
jgi:hypothetical protein